MKIFTHLTTLSMTLAMGLTLTLGLASVSRAADCPDFSGTFQKTDVATGTILNDSLVIHQTDCRSVSLTSGAIDPGTATSLIEVGQGLVSLSSGNRYEATWKGKTLELKIEKPSGQQQRYLYSLFSQNGLQIISEELPTGTPSPQSAPQLSVFSRVQP